MSEVQRLVFSIIQFLGDQLQTGNLIPDAAESLEVAIQCLEQAYNINHDDESSASNLQLSRSLLEIFSTALQNDERFRQMPPTQAQHEASEDSKSEAEKLKNEGNYLMKSEQYKEALECYAKAITLDNKNAIYYCNKAAALSKLNNHQAAISDCDKAIAIDPTYSKAYGRKGLAHASLNQHRQAKECYERAVQLDPANESYLNNLHIAEEKLRETNIGSQADAQGVDNLAGIASHLNFSSVLNNPALMHMATQMMTDPTMQSLLGTLITGTGQMEGQGPQSGVGELLQAGQRLAAQVQATNPALVEQLRRQMNNDGQNPQNDDDPNRPGN